MSKQSEKLFEAMVGLDDDLIREAVPMAEEKPRSKRSVPRVVLIAAALMIGAAALMAARAPGFLTLLGFQSYKYNNGFQYVMTVDFNDWGSRPAPVEVDEEGTVWFIYDGQRIDITGQFNQDNAYVYEGINPETGLPDYILVGGTPEHIGWGEIVMLPDESNPFAASATGGEYPSTWFMSAIETLCAEELNVLRGDTVLYSGELQPEPQDTAQPGFKKP